MQIASSGEAATSSVAENMAIGSQGGHDADVSRSLPERRAFTVASGPLANTPPVSSSSSAFSRVRVVSSAHVGDQHAGEHSTAAASPLFHPHPTPTTK
eukprot:5038893-Pleurochrysis_carterae.AAC.2